LTTRGRCLLASGLALALFALLVGQRDLLRAAVFLVVLPLAASWLVARTRYRLACERTLEPARVEAGTTSTVRLRLDNISRLPSGVLLMEDALPYSLGGRPRFVWTRSSRTACARSPTRSPPTYEGASRSGRCPYG
jgi:uncharacterized protein (DUF58 family)